MMMVLRMRLHHLKLYTASEEMSQYLRETLLSRDECPLQWWKMNRQRLCDAPETCQQISDTVFPASSAPSA